MADPVSTPALAVSVAATTLWTGPDAPREVDAPIVAPAPDPRAWPASLDWAARLDLDSRVVSQLLLGEPVDVIGERGDWVEVVAPWQPSDLDERGYPGWVPRAHLAEPPASSERAAVVAVEAATVRAPDGVPAVRDVSYAAILPVLDESGTEVLVDLPGAETGWLDRSACVVRDVHPDSYIDPIGVLAAARRFLGLDYLWGGTSVFGLDCSGLVHITFRALGRVIPRDAHDQAAAAKAVPLDEVAPGDLLFFAREGKGVHHVGLATSEPEVMLHAPGTGQRVEEAPMNADRRATLTAAGRLSG